MNAEQARALFLEHCEPGDLSHYGEKAAVAAILAASNPAGEVAQADREFAARWIVIAPQNAKLIRAGDWDHHDGVQAAMRHRLATQPVASQEAGA